MISFFYFITIFGSSYFFFKKRKIDCFTLAFFSSVLYFSPGFYGFVPTYVLTSPVDSIINETYLIFNLVLSCIVLFTIIFDYKNFVSNFSFNKRIAKIVDMRIMFILSIISLSGFFLNLLFVDISLLGGDKRILLDNSTIFYNFWVYPSIILSVFSFYFKKYSFLLLAITLLIIDMLTYSMRVHVFFTIASISVIYFFNLDANRLFYRVKYFFLLAPIAIILFVFKSLINPLRDGWKTGDYTQLIEKVIDPDVYIYWLTRVEPFNQVAILNEVVKMNFSSPFSQIPQAFLSIIPYSGKIDFGNPRFHSYFQPELFPNLEIIGTIANNPWAQIYSIGGWILLCLYIIGFIFIVKYLNTLFFTTQSEIIRLSVALIIPIICFYTHRNDLYFTILQIKRMLFFVIIGYLGHRFYIYFFINQFKSE